MEIAAKTRTAGTDMVFKRLKTAPGDGIENIAFFVYLGAKQKSAFLSVQGQFPGKKLSVFLWHMLK